MKVRIYNPIIGIPISILGLKNKFEILGITNNAKENAYALKNCTIGYSTWASINKKNVYQRLLVRYENKN